MVLGRLKKKPFSFSESDKEAPPEMTPFQRKVDLCVHAAHVHVLARGRYAPVHTCTHARTHAHVPANMHANAHTCRHTLSEFLPPPPAPDPSVGTHMHNHKHTGKGQTTKSHELDSRHDRARQPRGH